MSKKVYLIIQGSSYKINIENVAKSVAIEPLQGYEDFVKNLKLQFRGVKLQQSYRFFRLFVAKKCPIYSPYKHTATIATLYL